MVAASQNANISKILHTFHSAIALVAQKLHLFLQGLSWFWHDYSKSSNENDESKSCPENSAIIALLETGDHCNYVWNRGSRTLYRYQCTQALRQRNSPAELKRQVKRVCNYPCQRSKTISSRKSKLSVRVKHQYVHGENVEKPSLHLHSRACVTQI